MPDSKWPTSEDGSAPWPRGSGGSGGAGGNTAAVTGAEPETDEYGFSVYLRGDSDSVPKKEDQVDLEALAQYLYDLLRREALLERERLGIAK